MALRTGLENTPSLEASSGMFYTDNCPVEGSNIVPFGKLVYAVTSSEVGEVVLTFNNPDKALDHASAIVSRLPLYAVVTIVRITRGAEPKVIARLVNSAGVSPGE